MVYSSSVCPHTDTWPHTYTQTNTVLISLSISVLMSACSGNNSAPIIYIFKSCPAFKAQHKPLSLRKALLTQECNLMHLFFSGLCSWKMHLIDHFLTPIFSFSFHVCCSSHVNSEIPRKVNSTLYLQHPYSIWTVQAQSKFLSTWLAGQTCCLQPR